MAYKLALPPGLLGVHPIFHISILNKYHQDNFNVTLMDLVLLDQNLTFKEEVVTNFDRQIKKLGQKKLIG